MDKTNIPVFLSHKQFISFIYYLRLALLRQASNKNQEFNNVAQSLDFFLLNLPDNTIKPTDGVEEILTKENSQKVKSALYFSIFKFLFL